MKIVWWWLEWLNIYEAGHPRGLYWCSKYERHRHLPLGLIQWYSR